MVLASVKLRRCGAIIYLNNCMRLEGIIEFARDAFEFSIILKYGRNLSTGSYFLW